VVQRLVGALFRQGPAVGRNTAGQQRDREGIEAVEQSVGPASPSHARHEHRRTIIHTARAARVGDTTGWRQRHRVGSGHDGVSHGVLRLRLLRIELRLLVLMLLQRRVCRLMELLWCELRRCGCARVLVLRLMLWLLLLLLLLLLAMVR
jgi:hypothetical protein